MSLVVITQGKDGLLGFSHTESVNLPTRATTVVDTIGAGDSVMSGLIFALEERSLLGRANSSKLAHLDGPDLTDILGFALECAAVTVSRAGANPPWLTDLK